jgi:hypothetical protein
MYEFTDMYRHRYADTESELLFEINATKPVFRLFCLYIYIKPNSA